MIVGIEKSTVQRLMGERGLTGKALAEKMGLAPPTLSTALTRGTISHLNAAKLADALEVPYEVILRKDGA